MTVTDYEAAHDAILGQFYTAFAATHTTVPVAWPGRAFDPATDYVAATHSGWCAITVRGGEGQQASLEGAGRRRWRYPGVVIVQVFAPTGAGLNTALGIADDVAAALRGITASGVVLKAASIIPIGRDGGWEQVNVSCPFRYDMIA